MKHKIILKSVCNLLFQSLQANFWNLFVFYKSKARKPFGYVIIHIVFTCKWNWSIKYYCKWNIQVLPDRCFIHQIYFQYFSFLQKYAYYGGEKNAKTSLLGTYWPSDGLVQFLAHRESGGAYAIALCILCIWAYLWT